MLCNLSWFPRNLFGYFQMDNDFAGRKVKRNFVKKIFYHSFSCFVMIDQDFFAPFFPLLANEILVEQLIFWPPNASSWMNRQDPNSSLKGGKTSAKYARKHSSESFSHPRFETCCLHFVINFIGVIGSGCCCMLIVHAGWATSVFLLCAGSTG